MNLRDSLTLTVSNQFVRRSATVSDALRYVNTLRSHMQWEELDLFVRIEKMVTGGHTRVEAATYLQGYDPVFGSKVEQEFARLVKTIRSSVDNN